MGGDSELADRVGSITQDTGDRVDEFGCGFENNTDLASACWGDRASRYL